MLCTRVEHVRLGWGQYWGVSFRAPWNRQTEFTSDPELNEGGLFADDETDPLPCTIGLTGTPLGVTINVLRVPSPNHNRDLKSQPYEAGSSPFNVP
jgi:hypothetical protein